MKKEFFKQKYLVFSFLIAMALSASDAMPWATCFAIVIVTWKWAAEKKYFRVIPRKITAFLSVLLLIQVYIQYRTLLGQEASNTLLLGLAALKIMDYENERDHKFLVLLGFIIVSLKPIFSLDFYWLIPSFVGFTGLWISLLNPALQSRRKFLLKMYVLSAPITLILFFAFPRIIVPWAMARSNKTNSMGFSDELNPGSVSDLAGTDALAFRVRFINSFLSLSNLYWRGSVLTYSEGLRWSPPKMRLAVDHIKTSDKTFSYEVVLEPGTSGYIFTLDYVRKISSLSTVIGEYNNAVYHTPDQTVNSTTYEAESDESAQDTREPGPEFLQTPALEGSVKKWVTEIKQEYKTPAARIEKLRKFFSDPSFTYTLHPGSYGSGDLEKFLFRRRKGFCEHYAGSYATLARALGIPARVVIGYQGGVYNPFGDFWKISQKDAHAWVEIFQEGHWTRVDPTDWIAPLRLALGADAFFSLSEDQQAAYARSTRWRPSESGLAVSWESVLYWIDDLNYRWTYFLIDFDRDSQKRFWTRLSTNTGWVVSGLLIVLLLCIYLFKSLTRKMVPRNEIEKVLDQIFLWGQEKGLARSEWEPPLSYLDRLRTQHPKQSSALRAVGEMYDLIVYQVKAPVENPRRLAKIWRASLRSNSRSKSK